MRTFGTGATRDSDESKPDLEGFLSPLVLDEFARYMTKNRVQKDGKVRDSDNWQKGIPRAAYMKSLWRHFMALWSLHRRYLKNAVPGPGLLVQPKDEMVEALCALYFNVGGYLHEVLVMRDAGLAKLVVPPPDDSVEESAMATMRQYIEAVENYFPGTGRDLRTGVGGGEEESE